MLRLPRLPLAYRPPAGMPDVGPLPAHARGYVTFGSFSKTLRLNDRVVALWARLLDAVPGSRLLLNSKPFSEEAGCVRFRDRFAAHGIAPERLELVYTTPQSRTWETYNEIDIALDPFPHNAGTTTIEALWMGVPVLTLADRPSVGRLGASILGSVGLQRWVAATPEAYLAIGTAAAGNLERLAALRAGLRDRVARSPLQDAPGLARAVEGTYRSLWRRWCANQRAVSRPDYGEVVAAWRAGDGDAVRRLCAAILAAEPEHPDALHTLGLLEHRSGDSAAAAALMARALTSDPGVAEYHANLAAVLRRLRRLEEAEAACRRALELRPAFPDALNNLGNVLSDQGRFEEAIASFRKAIDLAPGQSFDAWDNLARLLMRTGRMFAAERVLNRACELWPRNPALYEYLGVVLQERGRLADAEEMFQLALLLQPDRASSHGARLFCLNYRPDLSAEEIYAEYRRWDETQARPLLPADLDHANGREPGRRLRVGYVSSDFRNHPVSFFLEPLLAAHDHSVIEIFCYAGVASPDAVTERLQALADHWRPIAGLDDQSVCGMIRADAIDLLVDLNGHTANGRLMVFAAKPAPVQVSYLIGHAYTSGLSAMDAFLADGALVPAGFEHLFSETVVRLPRSPFCYRPPAAMPAVGPLPALTKGHVTFGCFSRPVRLNDPLLGWWARLLEAVPGARLRLNTQPLAEAEGRADLLARFAAHGIGPERLELMFTAPPERTWAAYNEIDIALDPFPHNAGTTTFEALWMGVPVLTLANRPSVGRLGASILGTLGLSDWVAAAPGDYVAIGAARAADLDRLVALRAGLRARVGSSELCDGPGLARAIEAAYRALWQRWCGGGVEPAEREALIAAFRRNDAAAARELGAAILARRPADAETLHVLGLVEYRARQFDKARSLLAAARDAGLATPEFLSNLGAVLRASGRLAEAEAAYRAALAGEPGFAEAWGNLGNLLKDLARPDEAIEAHGSACRLRPDHAPHWYNYGNALHERGRLADAEAAYRKAVELNPGYVEAWNNLAACLAAREQTDEAEALYEKAIGLAPGYFEAHNNLGALLLRDGRLFAAERALRRAAELRPDNGSVWNNLGVVLEDLCRPQEAEQAFRQGQALRPDNAGAASSLLFSLTYRTDLSAERIFAEYRAWDERHARGLLPAAPGHANLRNPERRLRVGYVSADFRHHAVAFFFEPLLAAHDPAAVEVVCYAQVPRPDAVTARLQALAGGWRSIVGLDDQAVAAMVRADAIDVLVDLTGHSASGRLLVFARKPAPVQVSYLIGNGYTSGLAAMDAFLADEALVPAGFESLFSETVVRLPRLPLAYLPPAAMPAVGPLPALTNGYVTFGSFSRTLRLNDRVVAVWSALLRAVPGARLVLNSKPFLEAETRDLFLRRFAEHDISPDRIDLIHTAPQPRTWAAYNEIDIALDPFPHNAGTTTVEALWMGVPSLSRSDRPSVGRLGAAILGSVGLADWVAASDDDYVAIGAAMAADLPRLAQLRAGLRARFEASQLRDAPGLARAMEAAYRELWRNWCSDISADTEARPPELDLLISAFQRNDPAAARELGAAILARRPAEGETLHVLGLVEYRARRFEEARARIQAALDAGYATPEAHSNLGATLRALGRPAEAEAAYRTALALRPDFADAHHNLGNVLRDLKRTEEAIAAFRTALRLRPDHPASRASLEAALRGDP